MGKLFYGTQSGMTMQVLPSIQEAFGGLVEKCVDIARATPADLEAEDFIVLGGGTYGAGEPTSDWQKFWPRLDEIDFTGKKVALFALGDCWAYGDTFCSVMRLFHDKVLERGGEVIGHGEPASDYDFDHSESVTDGVFIGAALDEMNESHATQRRIESWARSVAEALAKNELAASP